MLDSFDRAKVGFDNIDRHDTEIWNAAIEAAARQVEHPGEPNEVSEGVRSLKKEIRVSPCTCHPSEAPVPCQHRYAFSECKAAAETAQPTTAISSNPRATTHPATGDQS